MHVRLLIFVDNEKRFCEFKTVIVIDTQVCDDLWSTHR